MIDKPLKSLNGKKLTGPLATPIDTGIIFPLGRQDLWQELFDKHFAELHRQRMAKMPYLAKQLGIKFEHLDLSNHADLVSFYGCVVENLAGLLIPGFQKKKPGKWPDEVIMRLLVEIEKGKQSGEFKSNLEGCTWATKVMEPDMARPGNKSQMMKKAKTLQNRISKLSAKLKREEAAKQLNKKPKLTLVKG